MVFCKCAEGREVIEWEIIEIEELAKGTQKEEGTGRILPLLPYLFVRWSSRTKSRKISKTL